jgi:hypothetical protein
MRVNEGIPEEGGVTSANTVTVIILNSTAATVNLTSQTYTVNVTRI